MADHRPPVLLLRPLHAAFEAPLSVTYRFLKPWESPPPSTSDFLAAHAESVRVILCSGPTVVDAGTISRLPRLECVVASSAGVDLIDLAECRRRGIVVCNAGDVFSEDAADYAVGMAVDLVRRVSEAERFVRMGVWKKEGEFPLGSKLGGKKVGIIGLGSIGSKIAKRLEAFNCTIAYNSRKKKPDVLAALGKQGIVINVGRGPLIDEKELVRSLKDGVIGGAGLDVFDNEPEVPSELFNMDNVVLSPHSAVTTPESFSALLQVITANLEAFFSNKPLLTSLKE